MDIYTDNLSGARCFTTFWVVWYGMTFSKVCHVTFQGKRSSWGPPISKKDSAKCSEMAHHTRTPGP